VAFRRLSGTSQNVRVIEADGRRVDNAGERRAHARHRARHRSRGGPRARHAAPQPLSPSARRRVRRGTMTVRVTFTPRTGGRPVTSTARMRVR